MKTTLILAAALTLLAGQALAHARLITAAPKVGSTGPAPKELTLNYSESLVPAECSVKVTGPGGAAVATGPLALDAKSKRVMHVPLTGKLAAGAYRVSWTMKTEDGHKTDGDFAFTVK
jgi:methionine-rich copper-binding protein CopC